MGGAGSQSWNDDAYDVYGAFITKSVAEYRKNFDD